MTEIIAPATVRAALQHAVTSAGERHRYAFPADGLVRFTWDADGPGRGDLIGEVIREVAPDVHAHLVAVETADPGQPVESVLDLAAHGLTVPFATMAALDEARAIEDAGGTWGEALDCFDELYFGSPALAG
jgi:hypothetical protein